MSDITAYEYTVQDGSITFSVIFNDDRESYSPAALLEFCQVLEHTAASLRFSLENPESNMPFMIGRPS